MHIGLQVMLYAIIAVIFVIWLVRRPKTPGKPKSPEVWALQILTGILFGILGYIAVYRL